MSRDETTLQCHAPLKWEQISKFNFLDANNSILQSMALVNHDIDFNFCWQFHILPSHPMYEGH